MPLWDEGDGCKGGRRRSRSAAKMRESAFLTSRAEKWAAGENTTLTPTPWFNTPLVDIKSALPSQLLILVALFRFLIGLRLPCFAHLFWGPKRYLWLPKVCVDSVRSVDDWLGVVCTLPPRSPRHGTWV